MSPAQKENLGFKEILFRCVLIYLSQGFFIIFFFLKKLGGILKVVVIKEGHLLRFPIEYIAKGFSATFKIVGHSLGIDPKFAQSASGIGTAVYVYNKHEVKLRHDYLTFKITDINTVIGRTLEARNSYSEGTASYQKYDLLYQERTDHLASLAKSRDHITSPGQDFVNKLIEFGEGLS
jgi:hypothetical protein